MPPSSELSFPARHSLQRGSLAGLILALTSLGALAQSAPSINSISPRWVQRGQSVEVTLSGENLADAKAIVISGDPGASATIVPVTISSLGVESSRGGVSAAPVKETKRVSAKLVLSPDAALSAREVRVVTANGISNPVTFETGHLPEVQSSGANRSLAEAMPVSFPAAVNGAVESARTDHFKFSARNGQQFVFEVYGSRIGSPLDSSLVVLDKAGKELARNEDSVGLDSVLEFKAPADGDYILQIRDFAYRGGGDYRYRLLGGVLPYVRTIHPLGARRGESVEVSVKGLNLGGVSKVRLGIDPKASLGRQDIRIQTEAGTSNPIPFDITDLREVNEKEPNSAIDQADGITIPAVINGKIQAEKDYDAFKFRVEQNQQFVFEAQASRFGSPLDALLTLADENGNVIERNDDAAGADARIDHTFPESGDYILIVEDLLGRGGEDYSYRIQVRQPTPDFNVRVLPDAPRIHRDGFLPVRCELTRVQGFNGAVRITAVDLPPGVFAEPLVLTSSGLNNGFLMLSARADAPTGTYPFKLVATASLGGRTATRTATPMSGDNAVKEGFLTILEAAPFTLDLLNLSRSLEQEQNADLLVLASRREGFNGEIKLTAEGFSAGREPITRSLDYQPATLKSGETEGSLSLRARLDSEIGTRLVVVRGEVATEAGPVAIYTKPLPMSIQQLPFALTTTLKRLSVAALPSTNTSAACEAVFTVKAERRMGFNGDIPLGLEGLPEGVTVEMNQIPANASEATIKLTASEKAPAGKEFTLKVLGMGTFNDRTYKQRAEDIKLTVNAPQAGEVQTVGVK